MLASASAAGAMCSVGSAPIVADLQIAAMGDPAKALKEIDRRLAQSRHGRIDTAWLYAAQALAYSNLERNAEEIRAAQAGLRLAADPHDAPHAELLAQLAFAQSDPAATEPIKARIEAARRFIPRNSIADICSRAVVGYLNYLKPAEAIDGMGTAYRMALQQGLETQRAEIAVDLADAVMKAGDLDQAQSLLDEAARWADRNGLPFQSAAITFRAGMNRIGRKDYAGALPFFERSNRLSRLIGNDHFAAFAALGSCQAYVALERFADAKRACDASEKLFGDEKIALPRLLAFRSRIALGLHHYDEAIALTTAMLDGPASRAMSTTAQYKTRAAAFAGLGRYKEAYADLSKFAELYRADTETARTRETAALRTQIETDRQSDRNRQLNREIVFQGVRARYERQRSYLIVGAAAVLVLLLGLFLWSSRRHAHAQRLLASLDELTRLPNRRSASERGREALASAADSGEPVSIALLDVDHFKRINDDAGHAAGDAALTALAGILKSSMRACDIAGRWGGEEFVIILPGRPAAEAIDVIAAIRTTAAGLERPLHFSAGIAVAAPGERDLEAIIARADAALYRAKREGRNRSVCAGDQEPKIERRGNTDPGPKGS